MAQRPIGVTDRPAGTGIVEYRTRERSVGGSTVDEQYVICERRRQPEGAFRKFAQRQGFATFRTVGVASANWVPLIIGSLNGSSDPVVVGNVLRELRVQVDRTVASTAAKVVALSRCDASLFTGGTQLACVPFDSSVPGSSTGETWQVYGSTASDGGGATPLGGLASLVPFRRGVLRRPHTAVGMLYSETVDLLTARDEPLVLSSPHGGPFTESLAVQFIDALAVTDFVIVTGVLEQFVP